MSSLTPLLLRTEFSQDPIFEKAKSVYTPGQTSSDHLVSEEFFNQLRSIDGLGAQSEKVSDLGKDLADMLLLAPSDQASSTTTPQLPEDIEAMCGALVNVYEQVMAEVPV